MYSDIMLKGRIGYQKGWGFPLIVMERAKSDNPMSAVLCEVFGLCHECGSVYYKDIMLTDNLQNWTNAVETFPNQSGESYSVESRYFKGELRTNAPQLKGVKK